MDDYVLLEMVYDLDLWNLWIEDTTNIILKEFQVNF